MNTVVLSIAAGIAEIGGCFAFWSWLRRYSGPHNRYGYRGTQIGENVEAK